MDELGIHSTVSHDYETIQQIPEPLWLLAECRPKNLFSQRKKAPAVGTASVVFKRGLGTSLPTVAVIVWGRKPHTLRIGEVQ